MSWAICLFWETKRPGAGLVGRAEDVAGCTDCASRAQGPLHQEDCSEASRGWWPHCGALIQTVLQRFSLAGRGTRRGSWSLAWLLVSTPTAAAAAAALHCHMWHKAADTTPAAPSWVCTGLTQLAAWPPVFRHFLSQEEVSL